MKKYTSGFLAIAIAFAASAFTASPAKVTEDPQLHWFAPNGSYLGYSSEVDQEAACPGSGALCANGYNSIDEDERPVGPVQEIVEKQ